MTIPPTTQPRPKRGGPGRLSRARWAVRGEIGSSSSPDSRSWRRRYSSTSSLESNPSASAYVRRNVLTYVVPGSRSHSSFSRARRYFARIFVSASISEMSMRARIRASRSVAPISGIALRLSVDGVDGLGLEQRVRPARPCALRQRGQHAREIALRHEHLTGLGALVAGDDATAL